MYAKPAGAETASLQHILELLVDNKEPFNNNDWRREPWPARPYTTISDYQVGLVNFPQQDYKTLMHQGYLSAIQT